MPNFLLHHRLESNGATAQQTLWVSALATRGGIKVSKYPRKIFYSVNFIQYCINLVLHHFRLQCRYGTAAQQTPWVVEAATILWEEEIKGRRLIIRVCAMVEYHNTRLPARLVWRMVCMVCTIHTVVVRMIVVGRIGVGI